MDNKKIPTGVGAVVLIIIAITVSVLVWKWEKNQEVMEMPSFIVESKKSQIPVTTNQDNINKTNKYTNKTYGFEFEYPANQIVTSNSTDSNINISYSEGGHWGYFIETMTAINPSTTDAFNKLMQKPQYKNKDITTSDIAIDGIPAKRFSIKDSHDYGNAGIILVMGKNTIAIYGDDSTPENKLNFETFVKTFRFNK